MRLTQGLVHLAQQISSTGCFSPDHEPSLEGSTSEITAAATVSTITETKNKLPTQEVVPKQKAFPFPCYSIGFLRIKF
ncbi:hypothetical protein MTR_3g464910 [Medicago truncatula]|uniref:Uncharacterized protein n=1 Tax=Medicago truncatula TaxID=3880 RepID=A0A072UXS1_MEDTR|nr:hypothetical protein MTR_3g464910 [Medicago truncatula]